MANYKRKILSMFLVVFVILMSSIFLYIKLNDKEEFEKDEEPTPPIVSTINFDKELIRKYMPLVDNGLVYNDNGSEFELDWNNSKLYHTDKVIISSTLSSTLLFEEIKFEELSSAYTLALAIRMKYGNICSNIDCMKMDTSIDKITKQDMTDIYAETFGPSATFEPTSFGVQAQNYYRYDIDTETFYLEKTQGEIGNNLILNRPLYYKTFKDDKKIEIYAAMMVIKFEELNGEPNFSNVTGTYNINSNDIDFNCTNHYDNCYYFAKDSFEYIKSNLNLYKYTFMKQDDGNYYYSKTEKVS